MAATDDLIDFEVIETQKENIQSLPSGRSAKSLAAVLSPFALKSPSHTQDLNDIARESYEQELTSISDSDDPLDVYDRYVKWTLDAYPTAQATPQSQLLPLLERATKAFLSSSHYKNDPRYLRLWLHYIRLFSDAPRETFAYLSRHGVGESLALFYEEFAAWLEGAGRWSQAEEVYKMGIEKEARPLERLMRKFGEFEKRFQARPQDVAEPTSPALPTVRAALVAKVDPFAGSDSSTTPANPQTTSRANGPAPTTSKKSKLAIFSDEGDAPKPVINDVSRGWESIGSMAERKKENVIGAKPWNGETMESDTGKVGMPPKMMIFKDQRVRNPRSGRLECVYVNLEAVYPDPRNPNIEYCFEELRATKRAWLQRDWRAQSPRKRQESVSVSPLKDLALDDRLNIAESPIKSSLKLKTLPLNDINDENDENHPRMLKSPSQQASLARRLRREEKANKTRKIKMREVKGETQTIQTNLDSPQGPRLKRKKSSEPTMTMHTKAAQDEMYDIFNAPLKSEDVSDEGDSDASISDDDDDYTSAGESTGTGRISGTTSEYENETRPDLTETDAAEDQAEETENNTGWTDFDTKRDVPGRDTDADVEAEEADITQTGQTHQSEDDEQVDRVEVEQEELVTPTSPFAENKQTWYIPVPPDDFVPPTNPYRDPEQVAQSRRPFMTPIVEKTESSLGTATGRRDKDYFSAKTPCPKGERSALIIDEDQDEDDKDVASSPFQELLTEAQPANIDPPLLNLSTTPQSSVLAIRTLKSTPSSPPPAGTQSGPIIHDPLVNPMDATIRSTILANAYPPLASHAGYHAHPTTDFARRTELRRYCKSVSKATTKGAADKTNHTIQMPPVLSFPGADSKLIVKRELGAGAFAPVYLVEEQASHPNDGEETSEPTLYALKAEDPPTAWEFHILTLLHSRLSTSRIRASIIEAQALHLYRDECYLLLLHSAHGTLLDLINACARSPTPNAGGCAGSSGVGGGMDECLALWYVTELVRAVESLHAVGVVHGDVKADNVMVRFDCAPSGPYNRDGAHGWSDVGIKLIDFGRGIDMRAFEPGVLFLADWATGPTDCAEMQEARPWTYQGDLWGVAAVAFTCLLGRYIDVVPVTVAEGAEEGGFGVGGGKKWVLRESLKRYWQVELWGGLFGLCLNGGSREVVEREEGGRLPALRGLRGCREGMEEWLEGEGERRGVGLRGLVGRVAGLCGGAAAGGGGRRK